MEKRTVDENYIKTFRSLLIKGDTDFITSEVPHLFPADISVILSGLSTEHVKQLLEICGVEKAAKVLPELDHIGMENFLKAYSSEELAEKYIQQMDSDDAVYLLNQMRTKEKDEVIASMSDIEYASSLLSLLNYDEYTAGSLMAVELIKAQENWSVQECINEIRSQAENVDTIYVVYVTDHFERLTGIVTLKNILISKPDALIADVMNKEVISVNTSTDSDTIAEIFSKYNLVVLPVVNALGQLVGRITVDDVVEVIKEEAVEDYQLMSGITEDVDESDRVWVIARSRLPWLLIGLAGGIASSRFIEMYEGQLQIHPEMAFFMPLIAAMGGNAGVQSSAIVVQSLANNSMGSRTMGIRVFKELRVALMNGIICSLLLLAYHLGLSETPALGYIVSVALLSVIVFASILGTVVPLLLNRFKIDPALATGPFITTTNDILGLLLYFGIGRWLY